MKSEVLVVKLDMMRMAVIMESLNRGFQQAYPAVVTVQTDIPYQLINAIEA